MSIKPHFPFDFLTVRGIYMNFEVIAVRGFKNVKNTRLALSDMTALISANGYGKSNVMEAIDFGMNFIKSTPKNKIKLMGIRQVIPLNSNMENDNFGFSFTAKSVINQIEYTVVYSYSFVWRKNDKSGMKILDETLTFRKSKELKCKDITLISRTEDNAKYRSSENGRCSNKINIKPNELVVNKLSAFDALYYSELIAQINNLAYYIDSKFDTKDAYTLSPFVDNNIDIFDLENDGNVPRIVSQLMEQHKEKYNLLINAFKVLFPNIDEVYPKKISLQLESIKNKKALKDLPFTLTDDNYILYVKDVNLNQPIPFSALSDGTKRIFYLLTLAVLSDLNEVSLISLEEPENCIHPLMMQSLLRILTTLSPNCKFIVSSHSPYLVQYLDISSIHVGIPSEDGIAIFKKVNKKKENKLLRDASSLNLSVGEYIFNLISGDKTDIENLRLYLEA